MRIPKRFRQIAAAEASPSASLAHLADAIASGNGGAFEMTVYHDDDCPKLQGGACRFNPETRMGAPRQKGDN